MTNESAIQCPKCGAVSGDAWTQCQGSCPMLMSPHYDPLVYGYPPGYSEPEPSHVEFPVEGNT